MFLITSTTHNYKGKIIGRDCIVRANTIGHEIHITRHIVLFLLSKNLISLNDTIVTKNKERFFLYNSVFKNVIEYDTFNPNGDEFYYVNELNLLHENISYEPLDIEKRFSLLLDVRKHNIFIRSEIYTNYIKRINYLPIYEENQFAVVHNRHIMYESYYDQDKNINMTKEIIKTLLQLQLKVYVFSNIYFETEENVLFINDMHVYASLMNNSNCIAVISEYSGAGQLSQYCHNKDIYYYANGYPVYNDPSIIYEANDKNNIYSKFDMKVFSDAKIHNFRTHTEVIQSLKNNYKHLYFPYKIYYGSDDVKIDITNLLLETNKETILIPIGDFQRAAIYGDPIDGVIKSIYIEKKDKTVFKYSVHVQIEINLKDFKIKCKNYINSVAVCIAKYESDYLFNFINYHLLLGFNKIYIYDNEDVPTYNHLIHNMHFMNPSITEKVFVIHFPGNNFYKGVQYIALEHFINNYIHQFTHVAHIDIDEYIVLKKHKCINDFISEYIVDDCAGIGMNWRHFGSNGHQQKNGLPDIVRFTKCELQGNTHIKTIFDTSMYDGWSTVHNILTKPGAFVKNTKGDIIDGPHNENIDFSVIQLNHYKCKTLPEFEYIRMRGRADLAEQPTENVIESFEKYNLNEIEDYGAFIFYSQNITTFLNNLQSTNAHLNLGVIEGYCEQVPQQLIDLVNIVKSFGTKKIKILEIGFNAGHSSNLFLNEPNTSVVSFDINEHTYTQYAKIYIDYVYPDRHTLVIGDSTQTIPRYPDSKFDVIFIDGGHDYNIAKQDLENCRRFAHKDTIVIIDDTIYTPSWVYGYTVGPTQAWVEGIQQGYIFELNKADYSPGRGMSWGKYSSFLN
jgi:predicted O-methyltransferase YrrM